MLNLLNEFVIKSTCTAQCIRCSTFKDLHLKTARTDFNHDSRFDEIDGNEISGDQIFIKIAVINSHMGISNILNQNDTVSEKSQNVLLIIYNTLQIKKFRQILGRWNKKGFYGMS